MRKLKTDIALLQETLLLEEDFHRLKKWWFGEVKGLEAKGRKAGVITLLRKNLPFKITQTNKDDEGRRLTIILVPEGQPTHTTITISILYSPNSPKRVYFQTLGDWFYNSSMSNHIMGGDLNMTANVIEDRRYIGMDKRQKKKDNKEKQNGQTQTPTYLADFLEHSQLIDTWRYTHPIDREYTTSSIHIKALREQTIF